MARESWRSRRGVTLVEVLLMSFLSIALLVVAYNLLGRSVKVSDASSHSLRLQVGARNLVQNIVDDMGQTHMLLPPPAGPLENNLSLATYLDATGNGRLPLNTSAAYPFLETTGPTRQRLDVIRVDYVFDPARRRVVRREVTGILEMGSRDNEPFFLQDFTFRPGSTPAVERELATSVEKFEITPVGYEPGSGRLVRAGPGGPIGLEKTACIALHLVAVEDEGAYAREPKVPRIEILTKIWCTKRTNDEMYREYFSSGDEDLRY